MAPVDFAGARDAQHLTHLGLIFCSLQCTVETTTGTEKCKTKNAFSGSYIFRNEDTPQQNVLCPLQRELKQFHAHMFLDSKTPYI